MEEQKSFFLVNQKNIKKVIWIISIGIPLIVVALFQIKIDYEMAFLPYVNAVINSLTLVCIFLALYFIKNKNRKMHERMMTTALILSVLFLLFYLLYHASSEEAKFGGEGVIRYFYFTLLISHILLSTIIVPLVLISLLYAKMEAFTKHKKIARYTFFIWAYVLISGILVFLMIEPYY
jgi:putative membrane protein